MLHNAFLVHDDIEDGSDTRRGVATMHRRAGVPIAINVGDAMNALAMRLFRMAGARLGPACALRILDEVDHLIVETLEGQAMELGWMRDNDLTLGPDDYLRLVLKKTAWYSFTPCGSARLWPTAKIRISAGSTPSAFWLDWRSRSQTTF
jgi:geranylgeranyl diphosphate synthase type II